MIQDIILKNAIFDELKVALQNDVHPIEYNTNRENWDSYTTLLARFQNDLQAGNIDVEYDYFIISRMTTDGRERIELGEVPVGEMGDSYSFDDYTPPIGDYTYLITPMVTSEQTRGASMEIRNVKVEFNGVWLVDRSDGFLFGFDKQWGSKTNWDISLNQKRIEIPTFGAYQSVYFLPGSYATFSLTTVLVPTDYSFAEWCNLVDKIENHVPLMIKSGSGDVYICDIHSPQKSSWLIEAHRGHDPITITLQCMEIMDYMDYIREVF